LNLQLFQIGDAFCYTHNPANIVPMHVKRCISFYVFSRILMGVIIYFFICNNLGSFNAVPYTSAMLDMTTEWSILVKTRRFGSWLYSRIQVTLWHWEIFFFTLRPVAAIGVEFESFRILGTLVIIVLM
jgi:hypothetical protein